MSEEFNVIESGTYCPDCVGAEFDGECWRHYTVADMLAKAEEWRSEEFEEVTPPSRWEASQARQWREWCAALGTGGGIVHRLFRSTAAPAKVVAFLEDVEF